MSHIFRKFSKCSDTQKNCCNHSKILTMWLYHRVMSPDDADEMAVCPGIYVRKLRIIRYIYFVEQSQRSKFSTHLFFSTLYKNSYIVLAIEPPGVQIHDQTGLIAGLAVGSTLVVLITGAVAFYCYHHNKWRLFMKRPLTAEEYVNPEETTHTTAYPVTKVYYKDK